ncbi:MAG TPA: ABC transporter permease [Terriglobia bacterium]|nr:ABC transporter permease [Terriglobia bacterium]
MLTKNQKQSLTRFLRMATSIVLFLVAWEIVSRLGLVHPSLFPPPSRVFLALIEMARTGELARDVRASLWRAALGFVFGGAAGIAIGLLTGRLKKVDNYLSPLIQLFRPLPPVAIIPLVIVWFGIGEVSKVFSIAFAVFFPVWINAHLGACEVPLTFLWSAQTLGVKNVRLLWKVIFPAALPFAVAGLRTGVSLAFIMVFVSELAGASAGIGYQISVSYLAYRVDRMMAALAVLGLFGAGADFLLTRLAWLAFPWLKLAAQR